MNEEKNNEVFTPTIILDKTYEGDTTVVESNEQGDGWNS